MLVPTPTAVTHEHQPTGKAPDMTSIPRFDHVGITVDDLDAATAFFESIGLQVEGRSSTQGEFIDTVTGIPGSRTEIVMLRTPDAHARIELCRYVHPVASPGDGAAMANELGLRNVCFEVEDLPSTLDRVRADGYGLVGGMGVYEDAWRMAYVRGPDGIVVSLSDRVGAARNDPDTRPS